MAIEYGYRNPLDGVMVFPNWNREAAENWCKATGSTLIAREVSEPWVVSIRD